MVIIIIMTTGIHVFYIIIYCWIRGVFLDFDNCFWCKLKELCIKNSCQKKKNLQYVFGNTSAAYSKQVWCIYMFKLFLLYSFSILLWPSGKEFWFWENHYSTWSLSLKPDYFMYVCMYVYLFMLWWWVLSLLWVAGPQALLL